MKRAQTAPCLSLSFLDLRSQTLPVDSPLHVNAPQTTFKGSKGGHVRFRQHSINSNSVVTNPPTSRPLEEKRRFFSLLPPILSRATRLERHEESEGELWSLVQPFKFPGQPDIRLRMTAGRLPDGSLALAGPIAPTEEMLELLQELQGPITNIFIPSVLLEHWIFGPQLADSFPEATLWFPEGFFEKAGIPGRSMSFARARKRNPCKVIGVDALPEGIDATTLSLPIFLESALFFIDQGAVVLCDTGLVFHSSDADYAFLKGPRGNMARALGVYDRLGSPLKNLLELYPEDCKTWVGTVLDKWGKRMKIVVPAHGSAPVEDAESAFRDCYKFLEGSSST